MYNFQDNFNTQKHKFNVHLFYKYTHKYIYVELYNKYKYTYTNICNSYIIFIKHEYKNKRILNLSFM